MPRPPRSPPSAERPQRRRGRGRPPVISREQLLEVAREVFLERGIQATTAEVAERAGISEGTIFHRFRSKDALFRAAMRFDPEQVPDFFKSLAELAAKSDLRRALVEIAGRILEFGRVALPVMMMSWSNPTGDYSLTKMVNRGGGYSSGFRALMKLFESEMHSGRVRQMDSELLARIFMGSLHHYCLTELFWRRARASHLSPSAFAEGLVDVLLGAAGFQAEAAAPPRRRVSRL